MAFVLVQHLDPNHDSALDSIIGGHTAMPVQVAKTGMAVRPNHIYVIPANAILTMRSERLHVARPATPVMRRTSINAFLTSLAEDRGEDAVGIVLAGFGSDGTSGMAAIKEHGGLTLAQAEFDHQAKSGMPQNAASSGFVDHVIPVESMPAVLLAYRDHRNVFDATKGPDGIRADLPSFLATICAVLLARLGRDFSQYKTGTLMRRIQRRMHVLQIEQVPDYIAQLRALPGEAEMLFREFLISVTRFFRDSEAFEMLRTQAIPEMLAATRPSDPIRVWVAGCATGEEAYSVAMLLREALTTAEQSRSVQIFATDVDDRAIATARAGLYPATIAADLSPARLDRHFVKETSNYRIAKDIREMCLFSTHDLVKDPPFSRLDLISCRNLLIYFEPQLQHQVLTAFHYALRPGSHLLLGPSESVAAQSRLFVARDKRLRVYVRRDTPARLPPLPPRPPSPVVTPTTRTVPPGGDDIDQLAARGIARYAPAFVIVDDQHDILRFSGQTARYLEPSTGIASLNLFALLHRDLRAIARAALRQATATGERVLHEAVAITGRDTSETINLIVEPLPGTAMQGIYLVAFQQRAGAGTLASGPDAPRLPIDTPHTRSEALDQELLATKERLRNVTEALESANEELQSSNEEFLSLNEELQSANEELETSKEELQSLNEELQTINAELNLRNDSLVRSNSDLANLFDSTSIATLFLDNRLRIRRFTPPLLDIFNLREGDEGRPITDIVTQLAQDVLGEDVRRVIATLVPVEREVDMADGAMSYLMQIRPYRDLNNVIDGAVVTFVDISERRRHAQSRARLAAIVDSSQDAIISHDMDGIVTSWNAGAEAMLGKRAAEAIGRSVAMLLGVLLPDDWPDMLARLMRGEQIGQFDSGTRDGGGDDGSAGGGTPIDVSITISPVRAGDGSIVGGSLVARDVSARKAAERRTSAVLGELDHRVKNILAVVSAVVSQTLKARPAPEQFAIELQGRVKAIANAHSLLTQNGQDEVSMQAIIAAELAPFDRGDGRLLVTGPDVALTPKAGLALAIAVHELASNAAKYGALSTKGGRLSVTWTISRDEAPPGLTLVWAEADGPAVRPPSHRGFGTTLIDRSLGYELDAEVQRLFLPEGVRCTIVVPLTYEIGRLRTDQERKRPRDDDAR